MGTSSVTGDIKKAIVLGVIMIAFTLRFYLLHVILRREIPKRVEFDTSHDLYIGS